MKKGWKNGFSGPNLPYIPMFLKRLVAHRKRKLFLIVDNLQVHRAKRVAAWVAEHAREVELFFPASVRASVQSR